MLILKALMNYLETILTYYGYINFILNNASSKAACWLLFSMESYSGHICTICESEPCL